MAWTYYASTDASAPVLSGTAGSLITVLDAILTAGYGSQPSAGWTKVYSGTNLAAYRNVASAGANVLFRVDDTGTQEGRVRGYETMSDVNTGTNPFPTVATLGGSGLFTRKSAAASATARAWVCVADNKTCIFMPFPEDFAGVSSGGFYIGETFSYKSSDAYRSIALANFATGTSSRLTDPTYSSNTIATAADSTGGYLDRDHTTIVLAPSVLRDFSSAAMLAAYANGFLTAASFSGIQFPNEADGCVHLFPYRLLTYIPASSPSDMALRGRLRGLYQCSHGAGSFLTGQLVNGTGDLAGKTFRMIPSGITATGYTYIGLETSTPATSA